jgi:hypothetical protein
MVEGDRVKVLRSYPDDLGGVEFWELELERIGTVSVPYDLGQAIPRDSQVQVIVTTGFLGTPRVLELKPAPAPASPPAVAGDSAP